MEDNSIKIGFLEEAQQLIEEMETLLLDLEQTSNRKEVMDGIFRIAHNIKGSSKAVGFEDLGGYCHEFETYLLKVKNDPNGVNKAIIDKLLVARDMIALAVESYKSDLDAKVDFSQALANLSATEVSSSEGSPVESAPISLGLAVPEKKAATAQGDMSVRVNLKRVDKLIDAVGELVVLDSVLKQQSSLKLDMKSMKVIDQLGKIIREVQDLSMSLRMVPVKSLVQKLQRISRDTATAVAKDVHFDVVGEEMEIDKTILDSISDPLVHLVRNAIDHGLEDRPGRAAAGKNPLGKLNLIIGYEGGRLVIRLKDDGKGLDKDRIVNKAIEKGLIASADNLTEEKIFSLIFAPGFSTKQEVTEVSGRGVGLDVVSTCVNSLGGKLETKSTAGIGTEFIISLPLTVSIIEGMVVKSQQDNYIVPFSQVSETLKIEESDLKEGPESGSLLNLRGKYYPVYTLNKLLGIKNPVKKDGIGIVSKSGRFDFVILVDDVVGQQQIVVKQLGAELSAFKRFVGSSVLGDGKPALILDLVQLADSAYQNKGAA